MVCGGEEKTKADYITHALSCFNFAFREKLAWWERGFANLTRIVHKEERVVTR